MSNELTLHTAQHNVVEERQIQSVISSFPVTVAGKIETRGEIDTFWIEVQAGETLAFHCSPGTTSFDPSLALVEPSGSWFEKDRLNRIAFNDEPLHFPGLSHEAHLVHRFEKGGKYALQVRPFSGQGGPDATYSLRISKGLGDPPSLRPSPASRWDERRFTRPLSANRPADLSGRAGISQESSAVPAFQAVGVEGAEIPLMTVPGLVEGRITKPAETHRIRLRLDAPKDLAIEIETPQATIPRFNPIVRLLAAEGSELVTNVYTKRNNNGLYMMKMIQPKATFALRAAGDYLLEIRDITTDVAADDFHYRVLVRPQIPHAGKAELAEDRINIEPGQGKPLTVTIEREEDFKGLILLSADGLPEGVTASAGMANPVEKPPLPNAGRLERYIGTPQIATMLFTASEDAKLSDLPAKIRVHFRTIVDGRLSAPIFVKEIPLMVIPRRTS